MDRLCSIITVAAVAIAGVHGQSGYSYDTPFDPSPENGYSYDAPDEPSSQDGYNYDTPNNPLFGGAFNGQTSQGAKDPIEMLAESIPGGGIPGQDYPILASAPETGFSCLDQQLPGYYADTAPEAGCQVFYICQFDGRQDGFLCPNGTIFNQQYFVCDWWFNVDCSATEQFLSLNADIGKVPESSQAGTSVTSQQQRPQQGITAPNQLYSTPNRQQQQATRPSAPNQQYSAPSQQQQEVARPSAPNLQYSAPNQQQQQVVRPSAPSLQYSAPNQQQVSSSSTISQQYLAPNQQEAGPVSTPSRQYSAPSQQRQPAARPSATRPQFSTPIQEQQQAVSVSVPSQLYSLPKE